MVDKRFAQIVLRGATKNYSHCILSCDHFDYTPGITFVERGEDVRSVIKRIRGNPLNGMTSIDMIFNYNIPILKQLNESPYNIEPTTMPDELNKPYGGLYNISDNISKAIEYATIIHKDKTTINNEPYIYHNLRVMELVIDNKASYNIESLLISACLHDTIKNAKDFYNIHQNFGPLVTSLVIETTPYNILNQIFEFDQDINPTTQLEKISNWGLVITLCDYLDNVNSIIKCNNQEIIQETIIETINKLETIISNRKLSNSQINIIKKIMKKLFELSKDNNELTTKLVQIAKSHPKLKEKFKTEIEEFNKTIIISNNYPENSAMDLLIRVLKAPGNKPF